MVMWHIQQLCVWNKYTCRFYMTDLPVGFFLHQQLLISRNDKLSWLVLGLLSSIINVDFAYILLHWWKGGVPLVKTIYNDNTWQLMKNITTGVE